MALPHKQELFVENLIRGMSQREAYRSAYPTCKSSDKTVDESACRLLKNSKVLARYNELRDRLVKEAEDEAIIEGKEVLREIASIARDNIGNYFNLEYLLRYYLFVLVFGAVDSLGKNMKLASFDGGRIWYPQVYDADKFYRLIW